MVAELGSQLHQVELIHLGEGLAWIDAEAEWHGPTKGTPSLASGAETSYGLSDPEAPRRPAPTRVVDRRAMSATRPSYPYDQPPVPCAGRK